MRKEKTSTLKTQQKISSTKLSLYRLNSLNDQNPEHVEDETEYLTRFLGKNYIENFEYLNYIEQEENIYLLKRKDQDRATAIAHLFKTSEFQNKIKLIIDSKKKIKKLCGRDAEEELSDQKQELELQEKTFNEDKTDQVDYTRLISWKKIQWDKEKIDAPISSFTQWLGEDGELELILQLVSNQKEYRNYQENKKIKALLNSKNRLKQYINYWKHIKEEPKLSRALSLQNEIDSLLKSYENGVISHTEKDPFILSDNLESILKHTEEINYDRYTKSLEHIKSVKSRTDSFSIMLSQIQASRKNLINKFLEHSAQLSHEGECPLCGYPLPTVRSLI